MSKDKFLEKVLVFVDRKGYVVSKESNPMSCNLHMQYEKGNLHVEISAYSHCMGNGSCSAIVKFKNKTVYRATSSFTCSPFNTKVHEYKSGAWEKLMNL